MVTYKVVGTDRPDLLLGRSALPYDTDLLVGHGGNDTLVGGDGTDTLVGGAGADVLYGDQNPYSYSGKQAPDFFRLDRNQDSLLGTPGAYQFDVIKDFQVGIDVIEVYSPVTINRSVKVLGNAQTLDQTGISQVLNASSFGGYSSATFTYGSRTFVAINDGVAGFQSASDAIIEITGYGLLDPTTGLQGVTIRSFSTPVVY